ncbi:TIR domain-containing protein [Sagittula sp. MA-2]|uniref:TIR domain-containing protein n=1 Tax=Sagittula sp. MA-2 TaxID=3048007 RepID=UPI0024C32C3A|nr:TIR domain-containing protein [Sagittula sp. MA-2]WHZ36570.1 TIR domain-containing protein [Sagittula sp. MA-2]
MIFISYASEDRERVLPFYELLVSNGFDAWMDVAKLMGGQDWNYQIKVALDRATLIVVFLSTNSVDKRGYAQREIQLALDKFQEKLQDDIYIIPVQLEDCKYPDRLKGIQYIGGNYERISSELLRSVRHHFREAEHASAAVQNTSEVHWRTEEAVSKYSGIPGYSTSIEKLHLTSPKFGRVVEIADHVNGLLSGHAMECRMSSLAPDPKLYNLLQDEWSRANTFDAVLISVTVIGRAISIHYGLHWYHAGAAHPIHAPKILNYLLDPVVYLDGAVSLFSNIDALEVMKPFVRDALAVELYGGRPEPENMKWICEGTQDWNDFSNFSIGEKGLTFHFSSYQVASYAAGLPSAFVAYEPLEKYLKDHVAFALDRSRWLP